jgi:hypothetical protein
VTAASRPQVEYFGHVKVKGLGALFSPEIKKEWRDIKVAAREGLARQQGRPAETSKATAVPARGATEAIV